MEEKLFDLDHLNKTYLKLAMPITVSLIVTLVYNIADTYFISQTGRADVVAGVSLCYPMFFFIMGLGNVFAQGGSSLISRCLGTKDYDAVKRVSSFGFYITLFFGIILAAVLLIFNGPILGMFGATQETFASAHDYYMVMAIGTPIASLSFIHSNYLRCEGLAKEAMIGNLVGTVTNIILDPVFISGLGMGAFGAALATVISYAISVTLFILYLLKKSRFLSVNLRLSHVNRYEFGQIVSIGFTAALLNLMQSISLIILNQFLLPYGTEKIAAMGIVQKVGKIPLMVMTGLTYGGIPLFGYLFGAKNFTKLKELIRYCIKLITVVSLAFTVILIIAAPVIMPMFLDTGTVVSDGIVMFRWMMLGTIGLSVVLLITILFQSMGKAGYALVLSLSRQGFVFIIALLICSAIFGYDGIIAAQFAADITSMVFAIIIYRMANILNK